MSDEEFARQINERRRLREAGQLPSVPASISEPPVRISEVPMTSDVARVLRANRRFQSLLFGVPGGVLVVMTILLAVAGGTATLIAFPIGLIAATLVVLAWSNWSRAGEDLAERKILHASGTIGLRDRTTSTELSSRRVCKLIVGEAQLSIPTEAADLVRSRVDVAASKKTMSLLTDTVGDEIAFRGAVEYAARSALVLGIRTAGGVLVWEHPELRAEAPTRSEPPGIAYKLQASPMRPHSGRDQQSSDPNAVASAAASAGLGGLVMIPLWIGFLVVGLAGSDVGIVVVALIGLAMLIGAGFMLGRWSPKHWYAWGIIASWPFLAYGVAYFKVGFRNPAAAPWNETSYLLLTLGAVGVALIAWLSGTGLGAMVSNRQSRVLGSQTQEPKRKPRS